MWAGLDGAGAPCETTVDNQINTVHLNLKLSGRDRRVRLGMHGTVAKN